MNAGHDAGVKLSAVTASETTSTTPVAAASTASRGRTASIRPEAGDDEPPVGAWADRMMKRATEAARNATVMVTIDAPWTSFIVVSTSLAAGQADEPRRRLGAAIARVMKKNGSTTSSTSSSGRRACSRKPEPGRGGDARVHARLLADATNTRSAATSAPAVTRPSLTQSPVGRAGPLPAAMRTSAAFWLTAHSGGEPPVIPGPANASSRKTNTTSSEPSSGAVTNDPTSTPIAEVEQREARTATAACSGWATSTRSASAANAAAAATTASRDRRGDARARHARGPSPASASRRSAPREDAAWKNPSAPEMNAAAQPGAQRDRGVARRASRRARSRSRSAPRPPRRRTAPGWRPAARA